MILNKDAGWADDLANGVHDIDSVKVSVPVRIIGMKRFESKIVVTEQDLADFHGVLECDHENDVAMR